MGKAKEDRVTIDPKEELVIIKKYDKDEIPKLTEKDIEKINYYKKILGFEYAEIVVEPKKRKKFKIDNAKSYIKKNDKARLKEFNDIAQDADKAKKAYADKKAAGASKEELKAINKANLPIYGAAYREQQQWFKDKYGEEAYDDVSRM